MRHRGGERKGSLTKGRERQKGPKLFPRLKIFAVVSLFILVSAGAASGGYTLYKSVEKKFLIGEITVSGNRHLSESEVRELSGLEKGESLIHIRLKDVAEGLLGSPWIRDVSVRKSFPHRVLIHISEKSPFAIMEMKGKSFLVDERGVLLEEMKSTVPFLPVVVGDMYQNHEAFMEALQLAKVLKEKRVAAERNRVEIIAKGKPEDVSLVIDGMVIRMGQGEHDQKLKRFTELEDEIKRRATNIDYVDLRFASRVVVKPLNEVVR